MIPRRLHLYWEGPDPIVPEGFAEHHDWDISLWSPDNLPEMGRLGDYYHNPSGRVAVRHEVKYRSNLVRFSALRDGGVWLDSDVRILRPLDELLNLEVFVPAGSRNPQVWAIGATPRHPFITRVFREALVDAPSPLWINTAVRWVDRAGVDDVSVLDLSPFAEHGICHV